MRDDQRRAIRESRTADDLDTMAVGLPVTENMAAGVQLASVLVRKQRGCAVSGLVAALGTMRQGLGAERSRLSARAVGPRQPTATSRARATAARAAPVTYLIFQVTSF